MISSTCPNFVAGLSSVIFLPNLPSSELPAVHTVPSSFSTAIKSAPVCIFLTSVNGSLFTCTACVKFTLFSVSPTPNCPLLFKPAVSNVPFCSKIALKLYPPAISITSFLISPNSFFNVSFSVIFVTVVPFPNCPYSFDPVNCTTPSSASVIACVSFTIAL